MLSQVKLRSAYAAKLAALEQTARNAAAAVRAAEEAANARGALARIASAIYRVDK